MEKKAYFLKHLGNGNIMTITDMNRKYCETIVKTKREYILLDENEQIIGELELTPNEAESFVEEKIKELIEREAQLEIKEIEVAELKQELQNKLAELSVKVDKRKKEIGRRSYPCRENAVKSWICQQSSGKENQ